jgi:CheY-like chemotaxis protein
MSATELPRIFSPDLLIKPVKQAALYKALTDAVISCEENTHAPSKPESAKASNKITAELSRQFPLRILVAEDNVTNQRVIDFILKKMGYRVDLANNGKEVIEALERQPYDLILMDLEMPVIDGLKAFRHIRKNVAADEQPQVVALTANASEEKRRECLDSGMNAYLTKPVKIPALVEQIQRTYLEINGSET